MKHIYTQYITKKSESFKKDRNAGDKHNSFIFFFIKDTYDKINK